MKTLIFRHFNDIVSLTILALMTVALIAGQGEAAAKSVEIAQQEPVFNLQVVLEVNSQ